MNLPLEDGLWHRIIKTTKLKVGQKKMRQIGLRSIMIVREESQIFATDALCRHRLGHWLMGGKSKMIA